MSSQEFAAIFDALLAEPLHHRPRDPAELERMAAQYFGQLGGWEALELRAAVREWLETPACEACGRSSARMPTSGELTELLRRRRREQARLPDWQSFPGPRAVLGGAARDPGEPRCTACNDSGLRGIERHGYRASEPCDCEQGLALRRRRSRLQTSANAPGGGAA